MSGKVTMEDVARAAGVHQTTVSLALRQHPRLPAATQQRIAEIAARMGYRVNPLAAAFVATRGRRSPQAQASLGYVSADPQSHGGANAATAYGDLLAGIRERASELGYGLDHFWLGDPQLTSRRFVQIAEARGVHGLIVAPLAVKRLALDLPWELFASVAYGYSLAEPALHRVTPDFYHGILECLRRLRAAGNRRIGLVLEENVDRKSDHLWLAAFLAEQCIGRRQDAVEPLLVPSWSDRAFLRWMERERPTAVLALERTLDQIERMVKSTLVLASLSAGPASRYCGINGDRRRAGRICVDVVVGQLHRNERGVPDRAQNVLVQSDWTEAGAVH